MIDRLKRDDITAQLKSATDNLLLLVRDLTYNSISNYCKYIISEIHNSDIEKNIKDIREKRIKSNEKKKPLYLNLLVKEILNIYEDLYDLNLYVYKSEKELTIIEIQYYLKSSLDKEYFDKVKYDEPMIHIKVPIPAYSIDRKSKFDINWEHGGLLYRIRMIYWDFRKFMMVRFRLF